MEQEEKPKVDVKDSFEHLNELAAEIGKPVRMTGRLDPAFLQKSMQDATQANLDFRNNLLEGLGEEPGIDPIDAAARLEAAYLKRLSGREGVTSKADFKLKTPYWVYLKKLADQA